MHKHLSYHYVTHKETDEQGYRVSEGKFAGVVWQYSNVKLPMYNDEGLMIDPDQVEEIPLTFDYEVVYNPTDEDLTTGELGEVLGDILINVIQEGLNHESIEFNYENRNDNTDESNI